MAIAGEVVTVLAQTAAEAVKIHAQTAAVLVTVLAQTAAVRETVRAQIAGEAETVPARFVLVPECALCAAETGMTVEGPDLAWIVLALELVTTVVEAEWKQACAPHVVEAEWKSACAPYAAGAEWKQACASHAGEADRSRASHAAGAEWKQACAPHAVEVVTAWAVVVRAMFHVSPAAGAQQKLVLIAAESARFLNPINWHRHSHPDIPQI